MSNFRKTCGYLGLEPPADSANACEWLEGIGLMFCGNFGTDNAVQIAGEVYMAKFDERAQRALLRNRGINYRELRIS